MNESRLNRLRKAGWVALGVMLATGVVVLVVSVLRDNTMPQTQKITTVMRVIIPPPPPPPPTPPPPPPPPQPQKMVEAVKPAEQPAPKPTPKPATKPIAKPSANAAARPPGNPLTAEAAPGANPYGLQAGDGSGDVIGGGGGGGGDAWGYYSNLVMSQVSAAVQGDDRTRSGRFKVILRVWVNATGQITRVRQVNSSGNELTDDAISKVLSALSIGEGPPQNMPQPINITIGARQS